MEVCFKIEHADDGEENENDARRARGAQADEECSHEEDCREDVDAVLQQLPPQRSRDKKGIHSQQKKETGE